MNILSPPQLSAGVGIGGFSLLVREHLSRSLWPAVSVSVVSRGHRVQGQKPRTEKRRRGKSSSAAAAVVVVVVVVVVVAARVMIATCSFLHRNQPFFFTTKEFFPHPPRDESAEELAVHAHYVCRRDGQTWQSRGETGSVCVCTRTS